MYLRLPCPFWKPWDWLIPLGIDVNHGYAKTPVINSEIAKKRETLQRRLENVQRWANGVRKRMHNASKLYIKRCQLTKERVDVLYRALNRDLEMLCARVAQEQPRLPDGCRLLFRVQGAEILLLDAQEQTVA